MRISLHAAVVAGYLYGAAQAFLNPIIPGFNPDPTIIRVENDYFLATSTFEFFPGVPIYHSTDLIQWDHIGHALNRPSQLNLRGTAPSGGVFAPTLRFHNGTYYMITTAFDVINPPDNVTRLPRSFYVTTTDIWDEKSWSDPTYVDQWGFDGDLFFDDDGKTYLTSTFPQFVEEGNFANWITEIDISTGNSLTESRVLHTTTVPEELGYPLTEASHLYKMKGYYYMMTADSGTEANHKSNVYRSHSLDGPWEGNPHNPVLWNGEDMSLPVLATGHADWVQDPDGNWWAVFLATRPQNPQNSTGYPQLGRETFLCPVTWDSDDWPIFNAGKPITTNMAMSPSNFPSHDPLYDLARPMIWRDDFENGQPVDKRYYTPRTPYKAVTSFPSSGTHLRLHANPYTLSNRETPASLLRKQEAINTTFTAALASFSPATPRQEAGATIYLSIHFHDDIAVTIDPDTGERCVVTHIRASPDGTTNTTYISDPSIAAGAGVTFHIRARPEGYSLGYSTLAPSTNSTGGGGSATSIPHYKATPANRRDTPTKPHSEGEVGSPDGEGEIKYVALVENKYLQTYLDGWQNFVGAHFGIYNTGTGLPSLSPADFDYIQTVLD